MLGLAAQHAFMIVILLYGVLLPVLASHYSFVHKLCCRLGLPVASLGLAAGFRLTIGRNDWAGEEGLTTARRPVLRSIMTYVALPGVTRLLGRWLR